MSDGVSNQRATAVALLFDDAELGGHLREALRERGASIVHEGPLSALGRDTLRSAEVVVVNLDDDAADELNRLYDVIDSVGSHGSHPRVVFNDAQASRSLDGWDRARWARHLAAKVLTHGDLDPPRPQDAPAFVPPAGAWVEPPAPTEPLIESAEVHSVIAEPITIEPVLAAVDKPAIELPVIQPPVMEPPAIEPPLAVEPVHMTMLPQSATEIQHATEESESLAAELEALLAADEQQLKAHPEQEHDFGSGLNYSAGDEQLLHDGHFGLDPLVEADSPKADAHEAVHVAHAAPAVTGAARPAFQLDHLSLAPLDETFATTVASIPSAHHDTKHDALDFELTDIEIADIEMGQAASWSLVDEDAPLAAPAPVVNKLSASEFGVEKLSAADFLAPESNDFGGFDIEPGLSLELISMETAIAPQQRYDHEMMLDVLDVAHGRILVLGAAVDSGESVRTFLAALPANLRLTILHTQHLGGQTPDSLTEKLAAHSALPVRVASKEQRAKVGEVLVVPADQQIRLLRDGRIETQSIEPTSAQAPSIDASFTMAANVFGRDAIAIVFAGNANDAVAGAQAIHDRGGQVWVESSPDEHFADMVHGVQAERLVHFSGTPHELAARLIDLESRR
ncbi:chemotaxis protein CheB [Dyella silvatica]|uniref:chemotaxis protein CheB n=1 Tax=Dyella silvatica TaxID=2992128 RepID=UPI0022574876|nr:chemotaxis protein CheB [Dyella silvatica]